jgi:hypothetical protein
MLISLFSGYYNLFQNNGWFLEMVSSVCGGVSLSVPQYPARQLVFVEHTSI